MLTILLVIFCLSGCVLGYTTYNLLRKNEAYETEIEEIYTRISITLHTMRAIDERKMFETDDEVGAVFHQLSDVLSTLRPIIYGIPDEETEKN